MTLETWGYCVLIAYIVTLPGYRKRNAHHMVEREQALEMGRPGILSRLHCLLDHLAPPFLLCAVGIIALSVPG